MSTGTDAADLATAFLDLSRDGFAVVRDVLTLPKCDMCVPVSWRCWYVWMVVCCTGPVPTGTSINFVTASSPVTASPGFVSRRTRRSWLAGGGADTVGCVRELVGLLMYHGLGCVSGPTQHGSDFDVNVSIQQSSR